MKTRTALLLIATLVASCNHIYYAPNTANIPILSGKGEVKINGLYSSGWDSEFQGSELQLACAASDHAGIMINGFTGGRSEMVYDAEIMSDFGPSQGSQREEGSGSYLEFAGGYFHGLRNKNFVIEIYGGYGLGRVNNDYGPSQSTQTYISKFFVQPAIGYKTKRVEFAFAWRVGVMNWRFKESYQYSQYLPQVFSYKVKGLYLMEPSFTVRGGFKNIKLQFSLTHSGVLNTNYFDNEIERMNLGMGVSVNFDILKKKEVQ